MKNKSNRNGLEDMSHGNKILLGHSIDNKPAIGFRQKVSDVNNKLIFHDGTAHLMTIGRTGSGKSRNMVIPNLLLNEGSAVVFDVKGELYRTTARRRRQMGQRVVLLDAFHSTIKNSDHLNLFYIFRILDKNDIDIEAQNRIYEVLEILSNIDIKFIKHSRFFEVFQFESRNL